MKFLIIGVGLVGLERVKALLDLGYTDIYIYDTNIPKYFPPILLDSRITIADSNSFKKKAPDWVFIATPHSVAKEWVKVVAKWGSKILMEKPFGRNYEEAKEIYRYMQYPEQIFVGMNYRFYPGIERLLSDIILGNTFGQIASINMSLGHGGSPGDEKSWKLNTYDGCSDCLLDPAIHFLDIINRIFPNKVVPVFGKSWQGFWNTGIKEFVHMVYDVDGIVISLESSLVKWRSKFFIEVNGVDGYGIVSGKGRSYGNQSYVTGKRWGWKNGDSQKDSEITVLESDCSNSFYLETKSLLSNNPSNCTASEALQTMELYDKSIRILE